MATAVFIQKFFLARIDREATFGGEDDVVGEVRRLHFLRLPPTEEEKKANKPRSQLVGNQVRESPGSPKVPDLMLVLFEADRWDKFELGKEYGFAALV